MSERIYLVAASLVTKYIYCLWKHYSRFFIFLQDEVLQSFNMAAKSKAVIQSVVCFIVFIGYFVGCETVSCEKLYRPNIISLF